MTEEDQVTRRETYQELGAVHAVIAGMPVSAPVALTVTDTFYASGRKDCTIKVPAIKSQSSNRHPN